MSFRVACWHCTWLPMLSLLPGTATSGELPPPDRTIPVTVYLTTPPKICTRVIVQMQKEVERIFSTAGVRFRWKAAEQADLVESACVIVFVKVTGRCNFNVRCDDALTTMLGWTHMVDGEMLPYCQADCDRIRGLLHPTTRWSPVPIQELLLSRALGRVVSHELYHALAATRAHSTNGISKATLKVDDLVLEGIGLAPSAVEAIRATVGRRVCVSEEEMYLHGPRNARE